MNPVRWVFVRASWIGLGATGRTIVCRLHGRARAPHGVGRTTARSESGALPTLLNGSRAFAKCAPSNPRLTILPGTASLLAMIGILPQVLLVVVVANDAAGACRR